MKKERMYRDMMLERMSGAENVGDECEKERRMGKERILGEKNDNNMGGKNNLERVIVYIPTEEIMPNRAQPRKSFDNDSLWVLAESIRVHGILQPITVKRCNKISEYATFQYELVAGERRLRAARLVGLVEVPCVLLDIDDKESAELAIIENLHREDLNIFEEAAAIASLMDIYKATQEEIAARLSITQSAVANKLRLLRLSEGERMVILASGLTERHARALLKIKDMVVRSEALGRIASEGMNVKRAEAYIDGILMPENDIERHKKGYKEYISAIKRAIEGIRGIGNVAKTSCTETDDGYVYTITVAKEFGDPDGFGNEE